MVEVEVDAVEVEVDEVKVEVDEVKVEVDIMHLDEVEQGQSKAYFWTG